MAEADIRQFGGHIAPIFANAFHVATSPDVTKIVFGEGFPDQNWISFHSSVTMRTTDAERLIKLLSDLIAKNRELAEMDAAGTISGSA